jgi:ATP-binding cassette, subfamily B, bacterial
VKSISFSHLTSLGLALRLIRRAAGGWTIAWAVLLILQGIIPAGLVYLTKLVVDSVAAVIGAGVSSETVGAVLLPAAVMAGLLILQRILGSLQEWVSTAQTELVADYVKGLVHARAAQADFGFYESSGYHDLLEQVNSQASGRILQLQQNVGGVIQSLVTFLSIAAILVTYSPFLPLLLLISALPALAIVLHHNKRYHTWWTASTARRRLSAYYDIMLTTDMAAAEVRINDLGDSFRQEYQDLRRALREERLALLRAQIRAKLGAAGIALLVTGVAMGWMVLRALRGLATIGDLALFYQAFNQGQGLVSGVLQNMGTIFTNALFLRHLEQFLSLEDTIRDCADPRPFPAHVHEGFRFEGVTFAYPGTERAVLRDFDLELPAGQIVAIVGENGAGKSTFIKLLCRFYDPQQGRITVDGTDIRQFKQADLRSRISVMFQFPMKYQFTAEENIRLGDLARPKGLGELEEAAQQAGADEIIRRLPSGYGTLLGRWFETGMELSGGEWQRVALARAFYRRAALVILDEPTSFMDSWSENEWLRRFRTAVEGRTALIVTHRFTTAMQADVIHVLDEGRLIESGTHAELLALNGHYATSWREQMRQAELMVNGADQGVASTVYPGPVLP